MEPAPASGQTPDPGAQPSEPGGGFSNPTSPIPMTVAGTGAPPREEVCDEIRVVATPRVPEVMVVLDRSGSMQDEGRWQPSVQAIRSITTELAGRIYFGLALFPDPGADRNASCAPGGVVVPVAEDNIAAIHARLDMTNSSGGTPTAETLQAIALGFGMQSANPDIERAARYVLLVTDGQPTCPAGNGRDTNQADVDASNAAVDELAARDVPTYVIGYDTSGPGNEALAGVLDGFAQRGGTMQHRPGEDEQSLLDELRRIAGELIGCEFDLAEAPGSPNYVRVLLDSNQINLDQADGWQMVGDRTVQLVGGACATFMDGGDHILDVSVACEVVVPG
jgi:hypothetical protein